MQQRNNSKVSNDKLTTINQFNNALKNIYPAITRKDIEDCVEKSKVSEYTIRQYLRGNVLNIETAEKILKFMKRRTAKRQQLLSA